MPKAKEHTQPAFARPFRSRWHPLFAVIWVTMRLESHLDKLANSFIRTLVCAAVWLASGGCGGNMPMTPPPPSPSISTISPTRNSRPFNGTTSFDLTVNGANFDSGSIITWNGGFHSTNFVSANQLTAFINGNDVFQVVTGPSCAATTICAITIDVVNSAGVHSNAVTLTIVELPP